MSRDREQIQTQKTHQPRRAGSGRHIKHQLPWYMSIFSPDLLLKLGAARPSDPPPFGVPHSLAKLCLCHPRSS